ncbi:MAG: aspartate-semialdehyde dehydrogenase [Candidatus Poribacteria bacterium]|nr:aspartate-semialdehyde dehydrogenase [Candidatus Poribacteria bacterium]
MHESYRVALVGATGAVGNTMLQILEERGFPIASLKLLASHRSAGEILSFKDAPIIVEELTHDSFEDVEVVFSSAGASVSREFIPTAVEKGALVIDNTSAFRMDPDTPLVVPEVNMDAARTHNGCIANPNCSTIQMMVALKPIYDAVGIKRIVVSTYQSVSGKSGRAVIELVQQTKDALQGVPVTLDNFPHQMAFNVAFDWPFLNSGDNEEEVKMINETRKILADDTIGVSATTVRVPVFYAHSESINLETHGKLTAAEARECLATAPGVKLVDDPSNQQYPLAIDAAGKDDVYVGRLREDASIENGLNLWVVADNLRKGAALNAIQIAENLLL